MKNKLLLGAGLSACALAWAAKEPIIMTVNGIDVPKSEFEYLYHKNAQQQMAQQPIDEYVKMFENYKLKVADAKAMGIDTMAAFKAEMAQYRSDLAAPYLVDSLTLNSLVDEAYQHALRDVQVSHLLLFKTYDAAKDAAKIAKLDSIRDEVNKGADFASLVKQHSEFGRSASKGGDLGFISVNNYPYNFEKAAYDLKPGQVSDVIETAGTYQLIKAGESRPPVTKVQVSHILRLVPKDATPEQEAAIKSTVDSIYNVVAADPSKFAAMAIQYSEDPGSASTGGKMDWFGRGRMVPEFETASFELADGAISTPVRTSYGYHIIQKHGSKGALSYAELKPMLLQRMQNPQDERFRLIRDKQIHRLAKKHKGSLNDRMVKEMKAEIQTTGLDSAFYQKYNSQPFSSRQIAKIGKKAVSIAEFLPNMRHIMQPDGNISGYIFDDRLEAFFYSQLCKAEEEWLEANEADYRNLLHEYRDGSLLYEASVRNVWDKASKDQEGLNNYFESHRGDYTWSSPRVKGILVQTKNDSVSALVKELAPKLGSDTLITTLRKNFKGNIKVDRVLVPQGSNAMVDNLVFDDAPAHPSVPGFQDYFLLNYVVLEAPEEMNDVRPQVTSDYQAILEKEWLDRLHKTYPVVVNEKVLKTVK